MAARKNLNRCLRLNEALIADEQELLVEEVAKDVEKEIQKMFKNIKIKL